MPTEVLSPEIIQEENVPEEGRSDINVTDTSDEESSSRSDVVEEEVNLQRELADAIVRLSPIEELQLLLKCGSNVSEPVTQGLTPLHYAVWQQYPEAVEFLIEKGCDINACDDNGYSALHLSAEHGYMSVMEVLLKHEAKVNFINQPVDREYPVNVVDEPLRLALKNNHLDAARTLLEHGANPNTCYFFGHEINLISPFNTEFMNLLLSYGANPNARDRQSLSPLMKACRLQQGMEVVLLLISYGADVNLRADARHDHRSVLHYAVLSGSVPIVNLLIKQGANLNFGDDYRRPTPLDLAILKGDASMVKLLVDSGADVNASSPVIGTPLHMVCCDAIKNRLEMLDMLLKKGADPNKIVFNEENKPLRTILGEYLASNENLDIEVVNLLLRYGAEVVMQNQNHHPHGILNDIPNLSQNPKILIAILEAAHKFDLTIIRQSSQINEEQRQLYLTVGQSPLSLKHLTRVSVRRNLGFKLPQRIDELEIPTIMKKYLLYEIS